MAGVIKALQSKEKLTDLTDSYFWLNSGMYYLATNGTVEKGFPIDGEMYGTMITVRGLLDCGAQILLSHAGTWARGGTDSAFNSGALTWQRLDNN